MTRGQIDMFVEGEMDYAAVESRTSANRFVMHTETYLERKKHNLREGWVAGFELHCEVRSTLILLLLEPCVSAIAVRRTIGFILADDAAMKLLECDNGLLRILLASLVCLKRDSGDLNRLHTAKFNMQAEGLAGSWDYLALPCVEPEHLVAKALSLLCENVYVSSLLDDGTADTSAIRVLLSSFMHLKEA
ncbi:hypothetical protein SRABI05_00622 [Agrobacterium fabrum]|uniref:hypothetical protein n=1 Tax=Agrobacterium fabrum TaxID=1176649 RepID=UPI001DE0174A|nr:hypothetical protein [Agrobacterium fabrum]CAH0154210.1 hypothetical protein SRABI05_00622 [Agrobacterium fabrum]CAH0173758.1 hypothetical protein SRABI46_01336 [Agrobacterium fabrum]